MARSRGPRSTGKLTREDVSEWLASSGRTALDLCRWAGLSPAAISKWLSGATAALRPENLAAVSAAVRVERELAAEPVGGARPLSTGNGAAATAQEILDAGDLQEAARLASGSCLALWQAIAADVRAPMSARMRAAENLMSYAWGLPPKLQAPQRSSEPAGDDAALLAELERLAKAGGGAATPSPAAPLPAPDTEASDSA